MAPVFFRCARSLHSARSFSLSMYAHSLEQIQHDTTGKRRATRRFMRWCHALPCANGGRPSLTELSYASPALRECQMRVHVVARYHQTQGGIATTALRVFGKTQKKALGHSQPSPLQRPLLAKLGLRRGESGGPESLGRERTCFPVARCLLAHELHGKEAVDFTTRRLRTQSPFSALTILLLCHEWLLPFHKNEIVFPAAGSQPMVIIFWGTAVGAKKNKISQDPLYPCPVAVLLGLAWSSTVSPIRWCLPQRRR